MKRFIVLILIISFCTGICGCEMTTTQQKGTAIGTGAGAGFGAMLGSVFGGSEGALIGASIGALTGAAVGYGISSGIEAKQIKSREEVVKEMGGITQKTLDIRKVELDPTVVTPGGIMTVISSCRAIKPDQTKASLYVKHVLTTPDGKTITIDSGTITREQGEMIIKTGVPIPVEAIPGAYSIKTTLFFEDISKDTDDISFHVQS